MKAWFWSVPSTRAAGLWNNTKSYIEMCLIMRLGVSWKTCTHTYGYLLLSSIASIVSFLAIKSTIPCVTSKFNM